MHLCQGYQYVRVKGYQRQFAHPAPIFFERNQVAQKGESGICGTQEIHIYIYIHTYTYTYTYIYIHIYIYIQAYRSSVESIQAKKPGRVDPGGEYPGIAKPETKAMPKSWPWKVVPTHRLHGSSFLGLPCRILNMNPKKELLWSLHG